MRPTAAVYDPLGFLSPYVIRSKLLIQKTRLEAQDWDELLPAYHQQDWTKWFRELDDLELVKITRCLKDPSPKVEELSIHTLMAPQRTHIQLQFMHVVSMRVATLLLD